jgi:multisubunit Na+/H+ antiporter MnhB subunit
MTVLTTTVARVLLPAILVVAAAWLVRGASLPGDGFAAGVTAGTGLLLQYVVFGHRPVARRTRLAPVGPLLPIVGLAVMVAVALVGPLVGDAPVSQYPGEDGHVVTVGMLELHTAVLYDVGIALVVFGVLAATLEILAEVAEEDRP